LYESSALPDHVTRRERRPDLCEMSCASSVLAEASTKPSVHASPQEEKGLNENNAPSGGVVLYF
jgi:hypothetical protein